MKKVNPIVFKRVIRFSLIISFLTLLVNQQLNSQSTYDILRVQAEQQMKDGKYGEAINLLNRYISANPQNAIGYNLRGLCFENRKEYKNAVYDFRSAIKLEPKNETISYNLNRVIDKWETLLYNRIVGYKREIELNPNKPTNYLEIGKCFKNIGEWEQAEKWYDEYLKREDPSADELIRYTEILAKNNHISKGEPWLKKYTEKNSDDHRLWSRYGYFTMWIGKKQTAIYAFKKSLKLRPYFKEALDGYDLVRGKGYVYTVNDTTILHNYGLPISPSSYEYPIDKYYRKISKNPDDHHSRILLVEELIDKNRFAEAETQMKVLTSTQIEENKISDLKDKLTVKKESYYWQKTNELEKKLSENLSDEKSTIELAHIYAEKKDFEKSLKLLSDFKGNFSPSTNLIYNYAQISSWAGDFNTAFSETTQLLSQYPDNIDYQLLFGKLLVWLNKDLDEAQKYLENVIKKYPNNYDALLSMSLLYLQKNELEKSKYYYGKSYELKGNDEELLKISKMLEQQIKLNYDNELYLKLEQARKYLFNKECEKAIIAFEEYLKTYDSKSKIKKELANAYLCKGDYLSAIKIYDALLIVNSIDFELRKQRAKLLYWNKNYSKAQIEFYELSLLNPEDAEVKLFLGDCYTAQKDFSNAKLVYYELLEISPSSFILMERLSWIEGPSVHTFPAYIMLTPEANYFVDNFDFLYSTYGLRFDFGVTEFLSLAAAGYAGALGSDSITNSISIFKGIISTRFSELVSASAAFGATLFPDSESSFLTNLSLKIEKQNLYIFTANFYSMDAAQVLYSPFLVDVRLRSNVLSLQGNYIPTGDWKFSGIYSFIDVSDDNRANKLVLRFGKIFNKLIGLGYEYYYYDVNDESLLYWSPKNFESHSIWADWTVVNNSDVKADIGGKLGYIPSENFVLREFYGLAVFRLSSFISLQARLTFGSTVQAGRGYSSTSFGISAFWTL
ncbi:MAG: tetratricopeptide repeat protein [Ignavibacteria bacterium]|nr:tetratricopeptide repeat protein [Ignavibacteria bacterium]MBT8383081.1 tetratricopeptide repeat protein [Ignavibacteria bacterium]MBT8392380.1 tetratricopeptide repeat protein [Ignavibacteria bacterium]NNJ52953.1 tetratricopeptide repeat protein [Ignavibacteriaceae bacterium]NNL22196.1 tetratricopeptide repeat protein [Ignavibacteriaceae bacterium]